MATFDESYEPPVLVEVGDFAALTLGGGPCDEQDLLSGDAWIC